MPEAAAAKKRAPKREAPRRGRPKFPEDILRQQVTMRLSPRVLEWFRINATTAGWQVDVDKVLHSYIDWREGKTPPPPDEDEDEAE